MGDGWMGHHLYAEPAHRETHSEDLCESRLSSSCVQGSPEQGTVSRGKGIRAVKVQMRGGKSIHLIFAKTAGRRWRLGEILGGSDSEHMPDSGRNRQECALR